MEYKTVGKAGTPVLNGDYWTVGKWFGFLVLLLAIVCGVYLFCHSDYGIPEPEYEYTTLSNSQVRQVNRILTSNSTPVNVPNYAGTIEGSPVQSNEITSAQAGGLCDMSCRIQKVLFYINSEFDGKVPPDQIQIIQQYLATFNQQESGVFLADYKFKVRSTFWLAGPLFYLECIFWVFAGVICSLLFSTGTLIANRQGQYLDSNFILSQIAKLFYAPFIALILLMSYNYFSQRVSLNTYTGQGMLILAFAIGFFSGRIMNVFSGVKNGVGAEKLPAHTTTSIAATEEEIASPSAHITDSIPTSESPIENKSSTDAAPVTEDTAEMATETNTNNGVDVQVDVKLDGTGLFDDEKNDISQKGLSGAIVTLHNVNGKDIIAAKKVTGNPSGFLAKNVKPGIYIARATLSMKLMDDKIVNLFGERTSYLTADKPGLELYIRKYEMND